MKIRFSIIIPVYNAEKYISQCVHSIIKQSYENFEVILVDDESKDESGQLCDLLMNEDKRIKVLHQKNSGTCGARNSGLKLAQGEYIMFMDNDDYWSDETALQQISNQIDKKKSDVIMFCHSIYWESQNKMIYRKSIPVQRKVLKASNPVLYIIQTGQMSRTVWTQTVRRELIIQNRIWFKDNIRNEDTEWIARIIMYANTYDWCEKVFYVYRKGHAGAQTSGKVTYKIWKDLGDIIEEVVEYSRKVSKDKKEALLNYIAYPYVIWMGHIGLIPKKDIKKEGDDRRKMKNRMKKYKFLLDYSIDPYVKKIKKFYHIFGWDFTAKAIATYINAKSRYRMFKI